MYSHLFSSHGKKIPSHEYKTIYEYNAAVVYIIVLLLCLHHLQSIASLRSQWFSKLRPCALSGQTTFQVFLVCVAQMDFWVFTSCGMNKLFWSLSGFLHHVVWSGCSEVSVDFYIMSYDHVVLKFEWVFTSCAMIRLF